MTYDRKLADRFWHALWGKSETDKKKLDESLQYAALTNKLWRAEFLLTEKTADPNTGDGFCVRWAAEGGHSEMIRLLARHGADMNAKNGEALIRAARHGHVATAKTLLENGADASKQNFAALRIADACNDAAFVRTLLNCGQDFTAVAQELMDTAGGLGQFDKAGLYKQYLDAKARPSAAAVFKPPGTGAKPSKP